MSVHPPSCGFAFLVQAEDGIRYELVPGVQTCALPIYARENGIPYLGICLDPHAETNAQIRNAVLARIAHGGDLDRKSVVEGKRVDLGGRRVIKKKKSSRHWVCESDNTEPAHMSTQSLV